MAQINKPSAPLVPPTTDADVENIVSEAIAADDTHASLVNGEVPSSQLPSYVDDVLEFADVEHFPAEGEVGKIYVALDTNYTYRWSGAAYVQVGGASLGEGDGIEIENDLISVDTDYLDLRYATLDAIHGAGDGIAIDSVSGDYEVDLNYLNDYYASVNDAMTENDVYGLISYVANQQYGLIYDTSSNALKVDMDYVSTNLSGFEPTIDDLATIRSGAAAGATAVQPAALDATLEVIEYQEQTPVTEEQYAKAAAGKLAIVRADPLLSGSKKLYVLVMTSAQYLVFKQATNSLVANSFVQDSINVDYNAILVSTSTRLMSYEANTYPVVTAVSNNFVASGVSVTQSGKRIIRELNLYPIQQTIDSMASVALSGSYNDLSDKPTILSQQDVQDLIDASVNNVLTQGF